MADSMTAFFTSLCREWDDTAEICPVHGITYTMNSPCKRCESEFDKEIDAVFKEEEI